MSSSVVVRCLQGDDDVSVVGQGQSSFCNGWSRNVAAQTFKLLALMRLAGDSGMQRKASLFGYQVVALSLFGSDRNCL
jgi:hypothetical protein